MTERTELRERAKRYVIGVLRNEEPIKEIILKVKNDESILTFQLFFIQKTPQIGQLNNVSKP